MSDKIKLDIVSDVVCPWCIIGYKRLEKAILEMGISDKIEVEWQPFELNPNMPQEGEDILEHVQRKYGSSLQDWKKSQELMVELGNELDFKFDYFNGKRIVSTRDAHVLLNYAKESNKQTELKLNLFKAYFSERKDVSDRKSLVEIVEQSGLDAKEALNRLNNEEFRTNVLTEQSLWKNIGISSVPTIVFNRKSALTGAQSVDVYKKVLTELITE